MAIGFLNFAMLAGLAAVALPFLAHLLSRGRYDVVAWGAMQFLELGRRTRRRIRLEHLLLMLLRMAMMAVLAVAMARPWISGGWLGQFVARPPREFVLIIDSSSSMGVNRAGGGTPHAAALQWATEFLDVQRTGDSAAVIEARDRNRVVFPLRQDLRGARSAAASLPVPSGRADLRAALIDALHLLAGGTAASRDVVVITDGQALSWPLSDRGAWDMLDEIRADAAVPPRIWFVQVGDPPVDGSKGVENFTVDRLQLSREVTAPDLPIRIETRLRHFGGDEARVRQVWLEIDGQRLATSVLQTPPLAPGGGEFPVAFEHAFSAPGIYRVSVASEPDALPVDDRSEAVIEVQPALPVLLVDGAPHADPVRSETFFARAALRAAGAESSFVRPRVVRVDELTAAALAGEEIVVLANVPRLSPEQAAIVEEFVHNGGGLLVAVGDAVDLADYERRLYDGGRGLLPARIASVRDVPADPPLNPDRATFAVPFLAAFAADADSDLASTRYTRYWKLEPATAEGASSPPPAGDEAADVEAPAAAAVVAARLSNGDPWLVLRDSGQGRVALLAGPLDADGNSLPARQSFVPFLHELLFHLASGRAGLRNLSVGDPLRARLKEGDKPEEFVIRRPDRTEGELFSEGDSTPPWVQYDDTLLPGVYRLARRGAPADAGTPFVVNFDRSEGDLRPLSNAESASLVEGDRMRIIRSPGDLDAELSHRDARAELWQFLLLVLVGLLVVELVLTRRLVQGGHVATE